jgi:ATP-binding cassette subfamily B protein
MTRSKATGENAYLSVLRFMVGHWRRQPGRIAFVGGSFLLATIADVVTPLFAGYLVSAVSENGPGSLRAALVAFVVLIGLGLLGIVMRQLAFMGIIRLTLIIMSDIARNAFRRVQRFSTDWHANTFAGSTVRKITRGMWGVDLLNDTILMALLPSVIMLVGTSIVLGTRWPLMGLIVAVGSVIYIALTVTLSVRWVSPAASLANSWDTRVGGALADAISCNAVVKGFGAEEREEDRLRYVVDKWSHRTNRTWQRGTFNGGIQGVTMLALRTAIIGFAILLWQQGAAEAGDITLVVTSFFVLQGYLRDIGNHIRNLQRSVNDMEELAGIEREPLGVPDRPGAGPILITEGRIDFDHVDFHYGRHANPLYRDFSVSIPAGQRVGLVGHSGSGKTTFVKLIQRLYDINAGRILIDGLDIAAVNQGSLRRQIAIVQQDPILFHRSLAENIAYARPEASRGEIIRAAEQASAHAFITALPKGYETMVGERGVKLSGGERQRVALARAFLADAPILILDEATSSLDSESEVLIQEAMERLMQGRSTIVIAHRLSTVRKLDRLLVFEAGEIVEEGTHEILVRREGGVYRRLFERQALELTRGLAAAE